MHRGSGYNEGSAVMQHSYGTVLFRLGQCQVLAGEHAKGRESLEEAVVVLGGETRLLSAIGEGWLRRRFLMLSLHSIVFGHRCRLPPRLTFSAPPKQAPNWERPTNASRSSV